MVAPPTRDTAGLRSSIPFGPSFRVPDQPTGAGLVLRTTPYPRPATPAGRLYLSPTIRPCGTPLAVASTRWLDDQVRHLPPAQLVSNRPPARRDLRVPVAHPRIEGHRAPHFRQWAGFRGRPVPASFRLDFSGRHPQRTHRDGHAEKAAREGPYGERGSGIRALRPEAHLPDAVVEGDGPFHAQETRGSRGSEHHDALCSPKR